MAKRKSIASDSTNQVSKRQKSTTPDEAEVSNPDKDLSDVSIPQLVKPDREAYRADKERISSKIELLNDELSAVREKFQLLSKGAIKERRSALHAELDEIKSQRSLKKSSRNSVLHQVRSLDEQVHRKTKDLDAKLVKLPLKTLVDVDARIKQLERQGDSAALTLVEVKRADAEISQCKRHRRIIEKCQAEEESVTALRDTLNDLRKQLELHDTEITVLNERCDSVKGQLDKLTTEVDEAYGNRHSLAQAGKDIELKLIALHDERSALKQQYKDAKKSYREQVKENQVRCAEREPDERPRKRRKTRELQNDD